MGTTNMEVSPFTLTPERYWTEEKERALIAFFSKHSCLWNHKSESYKNRQLRWKTLEHLRIFLSAHPPPVHFTVEDIKNKFKNLRTTFQRQYKMVKGCWDQNVGDDDPRLSPLTIPQEENQPVLISPGQISSFSTASSACVPSSMMVKCYWTEDRERVLIAFYAEHSCLWNKKSENHNNRHLRLRLLESLRDQLSDHAVSFSVEDIKCKFKNLRTVFNREYKAVQGSKASNKLYVPKWKHYQQLLFLCESCDEDESLDDIQILMPQEDKNVEHGNQTPSSTLSNFSSSSAQASTAKFNKTSGSPNSSQNDTEANTSAAHQTFLSASPDSLKLISPSSLLASPSTSPVDTKTSTNPYSMNVSVSCQSESRQSTDPCSRWTEAKIRQLISFYSEHSCLWNHKSESYRNRLLRQSLLETLRSLLSGNEPIPFTVEDIKTKFRNLRTIFQREHKAVSSNRTCGSEDFYLPKWKHYRELMFLCDSCDEEDQPEALPFHAPQESSLFHLSSQTSHSSLHIPAYTPTKLKISEQILEAPPSPTPPDSRYSSPSSSPSPSTSLSHTNSRVSGRKRANHQAPPTMSEMLDFLTKMCQSQTVSPHAGFLKYIEECLNETPPDKTHWDWCLNPQWAYTVHTDLPSSWYGWILLHMLYIGMTVHDTFILGSVPCCMHTC
ncbi:uncharacterized protein LOC113124163 isoform X2 [Mastacembelus armatus]|uniref:uncharacterized protein LOC113124163 isoform X2 n=1 Tax=Mastacembelus armatus TaxID=205130 RepID=UPI000E45F9A1|nr:uncharacterized protein LOC113124163 isoform X2 [Mastacembelus armatus]